MKAVLNNIWSRLDGDRAIWMVVLFMALMSILLVYSSIVTLAYKYQGGNTFYYIIKHGTFIVSGFFLIYIVHKINYLYFAKLSVLFLWLAIPLLVLTLITGQNLNNASRWLMIPVINQSFQTSDFAKLALILFTARSLALKRTDLSNFKEGFLKIILPAIIVCGLILPANFSTAAVLFTCVLMLMFMAGVPFKFLASIIPVGLIGIAFIVLIAQAKPDLFPRYETWKARVERYVSGDNAEESSSGNYQVEQAKIAIATGSFAGKGPGRSTQRNFLPHPYSDFIFAIVLEEYGFIGGFGVLMLYMILLYRSIRIITKVEKSFGAYVVLGLSFSLVFQGLINMAVNVNLLPVTGQPLPMMSMGGTSLWFTCLSLGIILSVSRSIEVKSKEKEQHLNKIKQPNEA